MDSHRDRGPAEAESFSTLITNLRKNIPNRQPPKNRQCGRCYILPTGEQRFSECAKCRSTSYCSRDCQRKAWPLHKLICGAGGKQREFVAKRLNRAASQEVLAALSFAAAHTLFESLTTSPDPQKMWMVRADLCLCPREEADLIALLYQEVPLGPLLAKQMLARIMLTGIYETEEDPPDPCMQAIWQVKREELDECGKADAHVIVVCLNFKLTVVTTFAAIVHPEYLDKIRQDRNIEIPMLDWCGSRIPILDAINRELAKEDEISKKMNCLLGDEDKMFVREVANAGRNSQRMEECVPELLFKFSSS